MQRPWGWNNLRMFVDPSKTLIVFGAWWCGEDQDKARYGGRAHSMQGLVGFLPHTGCILTCAGKMEEEGKQTGTEIESLCGGPALTLRLLGKDKAPTFRTQGR